MRDDVSRVVGNLSSGKSTLSSLHGVPSSYERTMLDHFDVEKKTALPLMRAYFGLEETSDLQRKMLEDAPENTMGVLIHAMGEDRF